MTRSQLLLIAATLDLALGDPESFPHPVRLTGTAITLGETILHTGKPARDLLSGALLTLTLVTATYAFTRSLLKRLPQPVAATTAEALLAWNTLAVRNLHDEASSVLMPLEQGDLPRARLRLARIVGRDTQHLDASEISRALIETLAESLSDGIIAPLFYLTLGGVPLAMTYKTVNTLDSMIGHADARYWYFGKAAARLDDAANFIPARLSALLLIALAPNAWPIWRQDGSKHKSVNAGHPEAAMAGALGVRLGGANSYTGETIVSPLLGAHFPPPTPTHARRALHLTTAATILGLAAAFTFSLFVKRPRGTGQGCPMSRF